MAASKRVKSNKPKLIAIDNWEQADTLVREMGDLLLQIHAAEAACNTELVLIKATLAESAKPLQDIIRLHIQSLEAFAVNHQDDFGKARSRKLNFGLLGWRSSSSISTKKDTLEKLKSVLKPALQKECITVKESVNRTGLKKLTDEQLVAVGARRVEKDAFFVEPALPEAVDYE